MALIELNKQAKIFHPLSPLIGESLPTYIKQYAFVGSRVICNPPPENTDNDILCLVHNDLWNDFVEVAEGETWKNAEGYDKFEEEFVSYRKKGSDVNIIATRYVGFYKKFVRATNLCKRLNLLKKPDRIAVFDAMFGYEPMEDAAPQLAVEPAGVGLANVNAQWAFVPPPPPPVFFDDYVPVGGLWDNQVQHKMDAYMAMYNNLAPVADAAMAPPALAAGVVAKAEQVKAQAEAAKMNELKKNVMKKKKAFWL